MALSHISEIELYDRANQLLSDITEDLNKTVYQPLEGKLTLKWNTKEVFQASASSLGKVNEPPLHEICISYKLVYELYKDCLKYQLFSENIEIHERVKELLDKIIEIPMLPTCFTNDESVMNMFMASLTWVYFHELGHLYQEHGYIREQFGQRANSLIINDCDIVNDSHLTQEQSTISHITELAADFFAVTQCFNEILRQNITIELDKNHNPYVVKAYSAHILGTVYLLANGLSCIFYRFYGYKYLEEKKPLIIEEIPLGSHPNPLVRLEMSIPQIVELLDMTALREMTKIKLDRSQLTKIFHRAAYSGAFFWLIDHVKPDEIPDEFFLKGIQNNEQIINYMKYIIKAWDEIYPTISQFQRNTIPFGTIGFTEQVRKIVFNELNS